MPKPKEGVFEFEVNGLRFEAKYVCDGKFVTITPPREIQLELGAQDSLPARPFIKTKYN